MLTLLIINFMNPENVKNHPMESASVASAAAAVGLDDLSSPLRWLAWRHPALEAYEPRWCAGAPEHDKEALGRARIHQVDALVVHGCSIAAVPLAAADLFVDVLYPAGCRTVVMTGGVGRETGALWLDVAMRGMTGLFGSSASWTRQPLHVDLPAQGLSSKPVLDGFSHDMPTEELLCYCSEADVFLEIFICRCRDRGLERIAFCGNPLAEAGHHAGSGADHCCVYLETASTHGGTNVEFSRATLAKLKIDPAKAQLAVVQHPQMQRRACLTWAKQTGREQGSILGWTLSPVEEDVGRSSLQMLRYALGEFERIQAYSRSDKGFIDMPEGFPYAHATALATLDRSGLIPTDLQPGLCGRMPVKLAIGNYAARVDSTCPSIVRT